MEDSYTQVHSRQTQWQADMEIHPEWTYTSVKSMRYNSNDNQIFDMWIIVESGDATGIRTFRLRSVSEIDDNTIPYHQLSSGHRSQIMVQHELSHAAENISSDIPKVKLALEPPKEGNYLVNQGYCFCQQKIASQASKSATPGTPFVHKSRPPSQVLASLRKVNAVFHQFEGSTDMGLKVENLESQRRYDELSKATTSLKDVYKKFTVIPPPKRANWVKPTPLPKKKQVTFQEPPRTSNRPTQKPPVQQNKKPNIPVNQSTRTKPATESRKPMPKYHTRNHHILPSRSVNARRAADHNRKLHVVDHNQFVVRSLKSVNTKTPQAKHSVNHTKKVYGTLLLILLEEDRKQPYRLQIHGQNAVSFCLVILWNAGKERLYHRCVSLRNSGLRERRTFRVTDTEVLEELACHVRKTCQEGCLMIIYHRLQRFYKSSHTAKEMTWHATEKCTEPSKMQHPVDGRAWKNFDTKPLIDDLKVLWAQKGVETIDVATCQKFNMRAMVLWTINDFTARSSLSGWSGQGYRACPTCNEDTPSVRVLGKTAYVSHRIP
ncbi:zinc finger, PHD-type containing protein [Tanacetum coccineum]